MAEKVFVYVDNSNIWIEGKKVSGQAQNPPTESDYWYRVESGKLLNHVLAGRTLAEPPTLYGSIPPPNDSVWNKIRDAGFDVKLFERNVRNREKGLDMEIGLDMNDKSRDVTPPATMILVAGDADYVPVLNRVRGRGWKVEVWYWSNAADNLQKAADRFVSLNPDVYKIGFREQQR